MLETLLEPFFVREKDETISRKDERKTFMFQTTKDTSVEDLCNKRDELDKEIKKFRESVLHPTKVEHKLFIQMKGERKKLQHIIKGIRKKEREKREKSLYEFLNVMPKDELKQWRVITHKANNIKTNLLQIQSIITELGNNTKFQNLSLSLRDITNVFYEQFFEYQQKLIDVENVVTKQFYRDKMVVDEHKSKNSES
jgi:hypothetical protein